MTTPSQDGYRMPGEFEPHRGCVMIWPVRPGSWPHDAKAAQAAFTQIARTIAESEQVWMCAYGSGLAQARAAFGRDERIRVLDLNTDDAWARDIGPTCVVNEKGDVRGIDWRFNAWGGSYDGLYSHWEKDDEAAGKICDALGMSCYAAKHFVLEGGSIHSDGEGTVLVTEACLLSPGRNPDMTKAQIEENLKSYLGAEKVIWLPRGIYQDETNEHVDNICAFVRPGEVALAWTKDEDDPQWELSQASYAALKRERDAKGRCLTIHKLPVPKEPIRISGEDLKGFIFEEGEAIREVGERLAASYVNFYIANGSVLVPQFGDAHDKTALDILSALFPEREMKPIDARAIIVGGGNIHCITQQIPGHI